MREAERRSATARRVTMAEAGEELSRRSRCAGARSPTA